MTTWNDLVAFVNSNFKYEAISSDSLKLVFEIDGMRSQLVFLTHQRHGDDSWVVINSPIGKIADVDLPRALAMIGDAVVGGLSSIGDLLTVRDAAPLEDMNGDELLRPMRQVVLVADAIEKELVGSDAM